MTEPMDRRESLRKGTLTALALSLGIPASLLAEAGIEAARFQAKFYAGDRLTDTFELGELVTRYLDARPTAVQMKWYDLEKSPREPLSVIGFTESRQLKIEF